MLGHAAPGRPGRLPRPLPRGRPRRALRPHAGDVCRPRIACWATTPSPRASRSCSSTCWSTRRGCAAHLGDGGARLHRLLGPVQALPRAPLRGQAGVRARAARGRARGSTRLPARYAELLSDAIGVTYPPTDYLEDVDDGFYCTVYLRAWAFEAQLVDHLRTRFGRAWFADPRAGGAPARDVGPRPVAARRGAPAAGRGRRARLRGARAPRPRRRWPERRLVRRRSRRRPGRRPRAGTAAPSGGRRRRSDRP